VVRFSAEARDSFFPTTSRPPLGPTCPPIQWVSGALSPGINQPRLEADHSPPSNVEVKTGGVIPEHSPCVFMALCLIR
jgi:hypothetical protein